MMTGEGSTGHGVCLGRPLLLLLFCMLEKIIKIGETAAVMIPQKLMEDLDLHIGDQIEVRPDTDSGAVTIKPHHDVSLRDREVLKIALNILDRYRGDFEALANK